MKVSCRLRNAARSPQDEKRSLFRELGLPYETDPAITKHLGAFLESAGQIPDAILFNGGFFIPEVCRTRVADAVEHWYGRTAGDLRESRSGFSRGARRGLLLPTCAAPASGVIVRGGLPRAYFIGIGSETAVCLVPRGTEEGTTLEVDRDDLHVVANRPVQFALFSSLTFVPTMRPGNWFRSSPSFTAMRRWKPFYDSASKVSAKFR